MAFGFMSKRVGPIRVGVGTRLTWGSKLPRAQAKTLVAFFCIFLLIPFLLLALWNGGWHPGRYWCIKHADPTAEAVQRCMDSYRWYSN